MATCKTSVNTLYDSVIDDVITEMKQVFIDEGLDEQILQKLDTLWKSRLESSRTQQENKEASTYRPGSPPEADLTYENIAQANTDNQVVIDSPYQPHVMPAEYMMPVQITLPYKSASRETVNRVLTINVPVHAVNSLHNLLTGPILTAVMGLPDALATSLLQQHVSTNLQSQNMILMQDNSFVVPQQDQQNAAPSFDASGDTDDEFEGLKTAVLQVDSNCVGNTNDSKYHKTLDTKPIYELSSDTSTEEEIFTKNKKLKKRVQKKDLVYSRPLLGRNIYSSDDDSDENYYLKQQTVKEDKKESGNLAQKVLSIGELIATKYKSTPSEKQKNKAKKVDPKLENKPLKRLFGLNSMHHNTLPGEQKNLLHKSEVYLKFTDGNLDTSDEDKKDEHDESSVDEETDWAEENADLVDESNNEETPNSEDDITDEEPDDLFDTENVVVCQYDKVVRNKNKWKFCLKDGIMNLEGKDFLFHKAFGDAEW